MSYEGDYWDEIPYTGYIALGRRGMESFNLTQCFIPGCDNKDQKKLIAFDKEQSENDEKLTETYSIHCDVCDKDFKLSFETIKNVAKPTKASQGDEDSEALGMGVIYVFDDKGKKYHLGYF